ncbi:MAG: RHS repeat-associated core domain-containing protein, partial [Candidatus Binatia bacterium]
DGMRVRKVTQELVGGDNLRITEKIYLDGCEIKRVTMNGAPVLERTTSHISDGSQRIALLYQWGEDAHGSETDDTHRKNIHYQLSNHLDSASLELDEQGGVITYEEYFPFGGTAFIAGSMREVRLKEYRYSGKERDDATGLYCYGYRYYAPWLGRWISPDPIGPEDGVNLYEYAHNCPVVITDHTGLTANLQRRPFVVDGPPTTRDPQTRASGQESEQGRAGQEPALEGHGGGGSGRGSSRGGVGFNLGEGRMPSRERAEASPTAGSGHRPGSTPDPVSEGNGWGGEDMEAPIPDVPYVPTFPEQPPELPPLPCLVQEWCEENPQVNTAAGENHDPQVSLANAEAQALDGMLGQSGEAVLDQAGEAIPVQEMPAITGPEEVHAEEGIIGDGESVEREASSAGGPGGTELSDIFKELLELAVFVGLFLVGALLSIIKGIVELGLMMVDLIGTFADAVSVTFTGESLGYPPLSAIGQFAATNTPGDVYVAMGIGVIEIPNRLLERTLEGDPMGAGEEAMNLILMLEGGVGAARSLSRLGRRGATATMPWAGPIPEIVFRWTAVTEAAAATEAAATEAAMATATQRPDVYTHELFRRRVTGPSISSDARGYSRSATSSQQVLDRARRHWGGSGPVPDASDLDLGHVGTSHFRLRPGETATLRAELSIENQVRGRTVEAGLAREWRRISAQQGLNPHDPANPYFTRRPRRR